MKILHLTLKKKWFDMIKSGEKKEEYREIKEYWVQRLVKTFDTNAKEDEMFDWKGMRFGIDEAEYYDQVVFRNGYSNNAPKIIVECQNIAIHTGKEEWGAEPGKKYFVIELGEIINL